MTKFTCLPAPDAARVSFFFFSEPWALAFISVFSSAKCGLPTYYKGKMPPLGAVDEPHWGQATINVVVHPGIFLFFHFPNYNAFLYLFKLQTYYYCKILPLWAVNELHWGQTMTYTQVSFFFMSFLFLSFFQLNWTLSFSFLGCKPTTMLR